jgi:hypothetical protein
MADAAANLVFIVFPVPEPSEDWSAHKIAEFLEQTGFVAVRHGLSPRSNGPCYACDAVHGKNIAAFRIPGHIYVRSRRPKNWVVMFEFLSRRERVDKQRFFFPTFFSEIDVL